MTQLELDFGDEFARPPEQTNEIIEMAKPYEWLGAEGWTFNHYWQLEAFAKLIAAKEREACLNICEAQALTNYWEGADVCAEAIRARGES